jgi:hypothetical protein
MRDAIHLLTVLLNLMTANNTLIQEVLSISVKNLKAALHSKNCQPLSFVV